MKILLLSTYELGHQPMGLARPAAVLSAAGHDVRCIDLSVQRLDEDAVAEAGFVGVSVPMHTAARLGLRVAERVRALNPSAHLCFYGLYATSCSGVLLQRYADSVIGGEYEPPLLEQVSRVAAGSGSDPPSTIPRGQNGGSHLFLGRQQFTVPRRDLLPALEWYAQADTGRGLKLAGYVEASRGCAHTCLHCPITPVYGGRMRLVQADVVLEDIRRQVAMGAEHITFGDPDFFNGVRHSLRILEAMHAEFPRLTFDATIKVEHLIEHHHLITELKRLGCLFIVSAVEAVQDDILLHFAKGHTVADIETALAIARGAGIPLRPTFVAFNPWISVEGYLALLEFVETHDLIGHVPPVQLAIRLLVPQGSALLGTAQLEPHLAGFDAEALVHTWHHPDPAVDRLQREIAALVEANRGGDTHDTFEYAKALALAALNGTPPVLPQLRPRRCRPRVPRLTEDWFC